MTSFLPSTQFAPHELTTAKKWNYRLWSPVSNMLTGYLGDQGWTAVSSFSNSWASYGAPYGSVAYRVRDGILFLRGAIRTGTAGASAFVLPSGYRPADVWMFLVPAGSTTAPGFARFDVNPDGNVYVQAYGNGGSNAYVDLSAIQIPIATARLTQTSDRPYPWPMTASPIPDGAVANAARWYKELLGPIRRTKNFLDADDTGEAQITGPLLNSWVNYGSGFAPFTYRKRRGVVYLNGLIKLGATAASIVTIAPGYLPAEQRVWACVCNAPSGAVGLARIDLTPAGVLSVSGYGYSGNNGYLSLSGISYLAED